MDGDGDNELWAPSDLGDDQIFVPDASGNFSSRSADIHSGRTSGLSGMNATFADLDNDGTNYVYSSQIFNPGNKMGGNLLWKWTEKGKLVNRTDDYGVRRCGWAWGAQFVDLNNDALEDLVVTNGMLSRNPDKEYWYQLGVMSAATKAIGIDARYWPPMNDTSLAGYTSGCVFMNTGEKSFEDVALLTEYGDDLRDGRGVAVIDYLNDGNQSLVVSNNNDAAGFYEVKQKNNHQWIGFRFQGTTSNRDGIGTRVKLKLDNGKVLNKQYYPTNTFSAQSYSALHFGLGNMNVLEATVIWPSGIQQQLGKDDLVIGAYTILKEPEAAN
jgi:hypothetical protein